MLTAKLSSEATIQDALIGYLGVLGGCTLNAIVMEYINNLQSDANIFLTFVQFLFASLFSYFIALDKSGGVMERKLVLPCTNINQGDLWACAALNVASSVSANWALNFNIPLPIHVIGRSTTVIFTIIIGWFFDGRKYNFSQLSCALVVTIGILLTSPLFQSSSLSSKDKKETLSEQIFNSVTHWYPYIGALLIFISMLCQAYLALLQDRILRKTMVVIETDTLTRTRTYTSSRHEMSRIKSSEGSSNSKHMKSSPVTDIRDSTIRKPHWSVLLFYTHFYGIFFFALFTPSIIKTAVEMYDLYNNNTHGLLNIFNLVIAYGVTQFSCVAGVYKLKMFCDPLYLSIVTNCRKLITIAFSVFIFNHHPTIFKIIGAILVVVGAICYKETNILGTPKKKIQ